jgi:hypothetical protein
MRRISRTAALILAVLLGASGARGVHAQTASGGGNPSQAAMDEAAGHFRRGVDLFKEADFRGALIEFRRANQLAPSFRVLYNIGQCYLELQDYGGALRSFQAYLSEGGKSIPRDRRSAVEGEIHKLQSRVAYVEITSNVSGAEVRVDDDIVGTTPLEKPILVGSGRRKITIEKAGLPPAMKLIDVAGGDRVSVSLPLNDPSRSASPAPATTPAAPPAPEPKAHDVPAPEPRAHDATAAAGGSSSTSYVWVGWTATGLLAAGTAVTAYLAFRAKNDFDSALGAFPGNASEQSDARSRTRTFALVADILGGATIIAGGVSLYFTLSSGKSDAPKQGASPSWKIAVAPQRLFLQGEF